MSAACHNEPIYTGDNPTFRRALWSVIAINGVMFMVEVIAGLSAGSMALQADALDFLGDSATYGLSLFVLARPPSWRANAALFKGATLAVLGLFAVSEHVTRCVAPLARYPVSRCTVRLTGGAPRHSKQVNICDPWYKLLSL